MPLLRFNICSYLWKFGEMNKGLRQGDPLASFLFTIVAESLHLLMEEAVRISMYESIKVGTKEIPISHLQYADDTIFFVNWSLNNLKILFKVLKCFHLMSDLKMNVGKSKLYGIGVEEGEVKEWAKCVCYLSEVLPLPYLGLPVGAQ